MPVPPHAPPPLAAPLVWQVCLLFWCAGVLGALWPLEGACAALLLLLADTRFRTPHRVVLALALCAAGLVVGRWELGPLLSPPSEPTWLAAAGNEKTGYKNIRICGVVRHVRGLPDERLRVILEDVRPVAPDNTPLPGAPLEGGCAWTWDEPAFRPLAGQNVCLSRRPQPVRGFANTPEPEQEARQAAQGVYWRLWSRGWAGEPAFTGDGTGAARLRERLRRDLVRVLGAPADRGAQVPMPQARAILPALLFGDRSFLSLATVEEFSAASLAHSLALSGQHLALAGLMGLFSVLLLARFRPGVYLWRPRAVLIALASLPPALAYLWLGNAPASLLRATCMLGFVTLWLLRERTATALDALLAALACIVLADPLSLFDLSLQLSVLCVAVICLCLPGVRRLWPMPASGTTAWTQPRAPWRVRVAARCRAVLHGLARIFFISLCIQVCLLPFMLARFGTIGLWFPLNVVWLPAVDLVVLPGGALALFCAALGLDGPARALAEVAVLPCEGLLAVLDVLRAHGLLSEAGLLAPHWTALPAFAALSVALAVLAGDERPGAALTARRWLLAGLLLLCVGPALRLAERLAPTPRLEIFDVGQGLAASLRLPDHSRILVDGGGLPSARFDTGKALLAPALSGNESPRLTAIVNSHPDLDHLGGLIHLVRTFGVEHLFHNGRDAAGERREPWREARERANSAALAAGDVVLMGKDSGYALEVLHAPRAALEDAGQDADAGAWMGNSASLVLRLTHNGRGLVLFTGDAEPPVLRRLLAQGADLSARVLVAPHHGSDRSFLPEFYVAVQPELVVAGCGFRNRWGYPGKNLRHWLASRNIPLRDTGTHGKISVALPENGPLTVITARNSP